MNTCNIISCILYVLFCNYFHKKKKIRTFISNFPNVKSKMFAIQEKLLQLVVVIQGMVLHHLSYFADAILWAHWVDNVLVR